MVSDETPKKTPKKRTGLFGGRAPKKLGFKFTRARPECGAHVWGATERHDLVKLTVETVDHNEVSFFNVVIRILRQKHDRARRVDRQWLLLLHTKKGWCVL